MTPTWSSAACRPDPDGPHGPGGRDGARPGRRRRRIDAAARLGIQFRIGIHCGPVVAGVIGTRKFIYDIWGDTVNLASRMESLGVPGRIQVTHAVIERLGRTFRFESRGLIDVKGKGPTPTWLLVPGTASTST